MTGKAMVEVVDNKMVYTLDITACPLRELSMLLAAVKIVERHVISRIEKLEPEFYMEDDDEE